MADFEIISRLSKCLAILGAESDLLSIVGSWKDTMPDDQIGYMLDSWIETKIQEKKQSVKELLEYCNMYGNYN